MGCSVKTGGFGNGGGGIIPIPEIKFVGEYEVKADYSSSPIYFTGVPVEQGKNYLGFLYLPNSFGPNAIAFTGYVGVSGGQQITSNIVLKDGSGNRANGDGIVTFNNLNNNISIGSPSYSFQQGLTYKLSLYEFTV